MKVIIEYEDGQYTLRAFRDGYDAAAYEPPDEWLGRAVEVPDHVVHTYAMLSAQQSTMRIVLRSIFEENYERARGAVTREQVLDVMETTDAYRPETGYRAPDAAFAAVAKALEAICNEPDSGDEHFAAIEHVKIRDGRAALATLRNTHAAWGVEP